MQAASALSQGAVSHIASQTSAVTIDISEPIENLSWEIATPRPQFGSRVASRWANAAGKTVALRYQRFFHETNCYALSFSFSNPKQPISELNKGRF